MFAAPNKAVEKFGISIADWSSAHRAISPPLLCFVPPSAYLHLLINYGPFEAKGKGRCSKGLRNSLCGRQKATVFISRLPEVMHSQRYTPSVRAPGSHSHYLLGIFPREPRNRKKANKGSSAPTSFYYAKDIAYLAHEPVLKKLREHKAFAKKLSRALGRGEWSSAKSLEENKPVYRLDHIIKERCAPSPLSLR